MLEKFGTFHLPALLRIESAAKIARQTVCSLLRDGNSSTNDRDFFTSVSSNNARASTSTLDFCSDIYKLWKKCTSQYLLIRLLVVFKIF